MSITATLLLKILLSFQPDSSDHETSEERDARLAIVAEATTRASEHATCSGVFEDAECTPVWRGDAEELALLLVTLARFESNFSRHVHEGYCYAGECDNGLAHSMWQLHVNGLVPWQDWQRMHAATPAATELAAYSAAKVLGYGADHCNGAIDGAISIYATGFTCTWSGAQKRLAMFQALRKDRVLP